MLIFNIPWIDIMVEGVHLNASCPVNMSVSSEWVRSMRYADVWSPSKVRADEVFKQQQFQLIVAASGDHDEVKKFRKKTIRWWWQSASSQPKSVYSSFQPKWSCKCYWLDSSCSHMQYMFFWLRPALWAHKFEYYKAWLSLCHRLSGNAV